MDVQIDGNRPKEVIFEEIDLLMSQVQQEKVNATKLGKSVYTFLENYS